MSSIMLRSQGYVLTTRSLYPNAPGAIGHTRGGAESIMVDPATHLRLGANDLRSPDSAAEGW
jgi:hypothetical protein